MAKKQKAVAEVVLPADPTGDVEVVAVRPLPPGRDTSGDGYLLFGLMAGAVLGAVAGLFLAPHRGDETRQQLTRVLREEEPRQQLLGKMRRATPEALDPLAQVEQYQAPPVREPAPAPYSASAPAAENPTP